MGVQGKQREMQAAAEPRHAIEKILALVLVTFLVIDGLLVLPAYASELRLDSLHPSLPIVNLRPLAKVRDQLAGGLVEELPDPLQALAGGLAAPSASVDSLQTPGLQTPTP